MFFPVDYLIHKTLLLSDSKMYEVNEFVYSRDYGLTNEIAKFSEFPCFLAWNQQF